MTVRRGDDHLSSLILARVRRLCCIFDQIEENLNKLILISPRCGQGWIVIDAEKDAFSYAIANQSTNPIKHPVDIDRFRL